MENEDYKINERKFQDLQKYFPPYYEKCRFDYPSDKIVYWGKESRTLPNITNLSNLKTLDGDIVFGSTFGHQHTQREKGDKREFQEIYEYTWYGMMFLRRGGEAVLYLLRPNEKVIVGTDENMTIFNFDKTMLITYDFANRDMNSANKELEERIRTCLSVKYERRSRGIRFDINPRYYEEGLLDGKDKGPVIMRDVPSGNGGYEAILSRKNEFAERGIKVFLGSNIPEKFKKEFQKPLQVLVQEKNKALFDALQIKR